MTGPRQKRAAFGVGAVFFVGVSSCRHTETDAAVAAEAGQIAHAVEALRAAPAGSREPELGALRSARCTDPAICRVKSVCIESYELEAGARRDLSALKRTVSEPPDRPVPSSATESLRSAETVLRRAYDLSKECADLEAALRRRFRLP